MTIAHRPLSALHRAEFRRLIEMARQYRHDGQRHARLLELAAASRVYFGHFKQQGN